MSKHGKDEFVTLKAAVDLDTYQKLLEWEKGQRARSTQDKFGELRLADQDKSQAPDREYIVIFTLEPVYTRFYMKEFLELLNLLGFVESAQSSEMIYKCSKCGKNEKFQYDRCGKCNSKGTLKLVERRFPTIRTNSLFSEPII
jgi:DNA-directed RNA polymerase subunit RPC12/RpoP